MRKTYVWVASECYHYEGCSFIGVARTLPGIKREVKEHRKDCGYDKPLTWAGKSDMRYADRPRGQTGGPNYYELSKVILWE